MISSGNSFWPILTLPFYFFVCIFLNFSIMVCFLCQKHGESQASDKEARRKNLADIQHRKDKVLCHG